MLVVHQAEERGYWGEVPALEGCFVQGETVEEVLAEAPEVIAAHLEALREDGQPVPSTDSIIITMVKIPMPPPV